MKNLVFLLSVFFISFGCSDTDDGSNDDNNANEDFPVDIDFTAIAHGELDGNGEEQIPQANIAIENDADWQQLITEMNTVNNESSDFSETNIDFSQYIVIGVFDQIRMTGGWSIDIIDIVEEETEIIVYVSQLETGGDNPVIVQPFHIVKIPIINKPIVFQ